MAKLSINTSVPDITTTDIFNNEVHLSSLKGKKILITFFRGASCPFCNLRVHQIIQNKELFEKNNTHIITFFGDTKEEILKYAGEQHPFFPIIADPKLHYYKTFGVESSFIGMLKTMINFNKIITVMKTKFFNMKALMDRPMVPADFLLNENHEIIKVHYGKDFGDHISFDEIFKL